MNEDGIYSEPVFDFNRHNRTVRIQRESDGYEKCRPTLSLDDIPEVPEPPRAGIYRLFSREEIERMAERVNAHLTRMNH